MRISDWSSDVCSSDLTSGNVSARCGGRLLITPSGVPYETLSPDDIVAMPLDADDGRYEGALAPSSEWRFHLDILRARPERSEERRVGKECGGTCRIGR